MKRNPFISLPGCVTALIFIAAMVGVTSALGGVPFSPGELSAQGLGQPPLKDYRSHVDFEGRCEWCHEPWVGVTATLCEDCHTDIAAERLTRTGAHGVLHSTDDCRLCHVEHRGRDADQTADAMHTYPHDQAGYSLVTHRAWPDGRDLTCRDCHAAHLPGYTFDPALCEMCHRQTDSVYVDRHIVQYSADCFVCHHELEPFDHHTFPLEGGHAGVSCAACHASSDFVQINAECIACHADPEIHAGMFGDDCAACHTITAWLPARLEKHTFPLDHGGEGEIACATCHLLSYADYTCTNCHAHPEDAVRAAHIEDGIFEYADCMECHADGFVHEDDERLRNRD